ncbi:MAG: signal peptide peptidase SppA [Candidatus Binatia bacterium]
MADKPVRWRRRLLILLVLLGVGVLAVRSFLHRASVAQGSVVLLDLGGAYGEETSNDLLARAFGRPAMSLLDLLLLIRDAGEDPRVAGLVVRVRPLAIGWAKAEEIRAALLTFRESGKPLRAYLELELSGGTLEYYVASAAEKVLVPPGAAAPVTGLLAQFIFLGGVWDKLDVDMQVLKIREYKTFGDMLANKEMSPHHREMTNSILDSVYGQLVDGVAAQRGLARTAVIAAIDTAPATPAELQAAGLIDGAQFLDELRGELLGADGKFLAAEEYEHQRRPLPLTVEPHGRIAVVYGVGPVTTGESQSSPMDGESNMGADTLAEAFAEAAGDDSIDAIVFRVDSPGGSALASDLIWRASQQARQAKPVIVSMSDVAASGGYYVAAGASRILALPGTMTGSIGVVLAKPNIDGLLHNLGINAVEIERGEMASMMSVTQSFGPAELERVTASMDAIYDLFLDRVAAGRGLDKAQVNEVGRGRVWTGAQAVEQGLVDELGGFFAAINAAKAAVEIPVADKVELVFYPRQRGLVERLGELLGTRLLGEPPAWWSTLRRATSAWRFPAGSVLTLMPGEISIR